MEHMNNTEKTLTHISHLHPLKLLATPEPKPICLACNMPCAAKSFGCVECRYYLHVTCATTKKIVTHPGHTEHTLTFELTPTYSNGKFECNACGEEGGTFCLKCKECDYDLHLHCLALPHSVNHASDNHPLYLMYESPYEPGEEAFCSICERDLDASTWFYLCEGCDWGGHVACYAPETVELISPGLHAPPTPPPQPMTAYGDLQMEIMNSQAQAAQTMLDFNTIRMQNRYFTSRMLPNCVPGSK